MAEMLSSQSPAPSDASTSSATDDRVIHEYDGIREYDNRLPNWWLYTLFGSIVFAAAYWIYYEHLDIGASPYEAYAIEMKAEEEKKAKAAEGLQPVTPELLSEMSRDSAVVAVGKQSYDQMCAACHGPTGGGLIGPNLTDEYWLHGSSPDKIYGVVRDGVLDKGMPAWGASLGEEKVRATVAYILTLRNTKVAGGKEPQGEKEL